MKLDRLLAMTMLLLNRKRVSAKELAERFEVSMRTVYRDMQTLQFAGIPVVSHEGYAGGYEIMDRYRLDRQFLSFEELNAIVIALRGIGPSMTDREIEPLLDKVGALLAKSEHDRTDAEMDHLSIDINPWRSGDEEKERLGGLREAIRERRVIEFTYTNGTGERTKRGCEPMRLVLKGYVWYLYGYCLLRGDFRIFRLSRIRDLAVTGKVFVRREDPSGGGSLRWGARRPSGDVTLVNLVLRFAPRARARAEDDFEPGAIRQQPDGSVLVRARRPEEPWLYHYLLGFGPDVRVLEPAETAAKLRAMAEEIVNMYEAH